MYIEHPYFYEGKYYANIDGEMIEITKEVAYAMNNFYRSSKAKKVEIKNELGEVVDKMLREVPYSGQSIDGEGFMIEDFPDLNCDVEHSVMTKMEQQDMVSRTWAWGLCPGGWGSWMAKSAIMPLETNCCSQNSRTRTAYWSGGISLGMVSTHRLAS